MKFVTVTRPDNRSSSYGPWLVLEFSRGKFQGRKRSKIDAIGAVRRKTARLLVCFAVVHFRYINGHVDEGHLQPKAERRVCHQAFARRRSRGDTAFSTAPIPFRRVRGSSQRRIDPGRLLRDCRTPSKRSVRVGGRSGP